MLRTIQSLLTVWRIPRGTPAFSKQFIFDVNTSAYGINSAAERSVKCSRICISWVWFPGSMENAVKWRQWDLGKSGLLTFFLTWQQNTFTGHRCSMIKWKSYTLPNQLYSNQCKKNTVYFRWSSLPSWSCLGEWFFAMFVRSILLSKASVPVICSSQIQSSTMQRCG